MLSKIKSIISEVLSGEDPIKKRLKEVNELARNFKDMPDARRERLLEKCTSDLNPQIKTLASDILRHNFDSISENTRNKLIFSFALIFLRTFGLFLLFGRPASH